MNNDWKPTEQNIGQPVLDTFIPPQGTLNIGTKWYDVDTTKLTSTKDIVEFLTVLEMRVCEDSKYFDMVKKFLIIPENPKTLDEIKEEFDEKMDELIAITKGKFEYFKVVAEDRYNTKFNRIIQDFEYAKNCSSFSQKLTFTIGDGLTANNYVTSNFVIKSTSMGIGYWDVKPNIQIWLQQKPNWLVRRCAKIFFDFGWKDV